MEIIQHYPDGLFPHIESGFERKPYFPEIGKLLTLGCRIKKPGRTVYLSYSFNEKKQTEMKGSYAWDNEQWTYYTFTVKMPLHYCCMDYFFTTKSGERSESFSVGSVFLYDTSEKSSLGFMPDWVILRGETVKVSLFTTFNDKGKSCEFVYLLSDTDGTELAALNHDVKVWVDVHGTAVQTEISITFRGEAVYGFGEKFDRVNQAGLSPLSYVVEQFSNQQEKTYLPIPFFFTDAGTGFFLHGTRKTRFITEITENSTINVRIITECPPTGELMQAELFAGTPSELIRKYTEITGTPVLPPRWVFGPWISSNGWNTQEEAEQQIELMNSLDIPATVMVLEAWSDEETFYIWNDAQYKPKTDGGRFHYSDFTFKQDGKWPDPKKFTELLEQNDVKLILWQIPVIKNDTEHNHTQLEEDIRYAEGKKLCVMLPNGVPYRIPEMWFGGSMLPDFSNPETLQWWFDNRRYLVEELGVAGFKTDGGEFLFSRDAVFKDGRTGDEVHNDFANMYIGSYHEFLKEANAIDGGVTFSRAGYSGAQCFPVHWAGDQISTFADLRGQLTAGLSLGLSGVSFWGFDIGGFAGDFPTTELYLRAAAFAAFAPIMQFHSEPRYGQYYMTGRQHWNNDRSPWNMAAANRDERIIPIYRKFAKLRMRILPYLWREAQHCVETSRPLMAHLIYDFCTDRNVLNIEDEYMLGRDLLVAPIIEEGAAGRTVYLPNGKWFDFWNGEPIAGDAEYFIECDLEKIPVFTRNLSISWDGVQ